MTAATSDAGSTHDWTWRTISRPRDERTDVLCLLAELWSDRCSIGFIKGKLDVCHRYTPTDEQELRVARYGDLIVAALPWAAPMRRTPVEQDSREMWTFLSFDRVYPLGWHKGWH